MKILKIGAFELPALAGLDIKQRYEPIGAEAILRAATGRGIKQQSWSKTRVVTSGSGWVPAGLSSIDVSQQHTLACVAPRSMPANPVTRQATLPAARRADDGHGPWGLAQMPNGQTLGAPVALVGHVATVADVPGAVRYQVGYYPLLTVWLMQPTDNSDNTQASYGWELVAEEV